MQETYTPSRLLVVSNRLPICISEMNGQPYLSKSSGGLSTAIESLLNQGDKGSSRFKEVLWFGIADFNIPQWHAVKKSTQSLAYSICPIFVHKQLYDLYYNGFSNSTLWPLFHYFPSYVEFDTQDWLAYEEVNRILAEKIMEVWKPGDIIWVHDYHLMLLPKMLREKNPAVSIGYFLHIPFPSFELFRSLPRSWKENLLKGLLGADLIGFHTDAYASHFLQSALYILGKEHQFRILYDIDRQVKVDVFPISIDYEKFNKGVEKSSVVEIKDRLHKQHKGKKIIFSVDRLDYSKGLSYRLAAYEHFLQKYPEWKEKVVFFFVLVPSRDKISRYSERKSIIDEHVSRINGKMGNINWQPLVYQYGSLTDDELLALYSSCDLALITPIRDGMNLVSKEFVASRRDKRGVLILSEMAGASSELGEALLINPTDKEEIADKIKEGLEMHPEQQEQRLSLMQTRVKNYNVVHWAEDFFNQTNNILQQQARQKIRYLDQSIRNVVLDTYRHSHKTLFLLDYDGTLAEFNSNPEKAVPTEQTLHLLEDLARNRANEVAIVSGRGTQFLEKHFGDLPIALVAEHGALIRPADEHKWQAPLHMSSDWKQVIRPILQSFVLRCPNTFLEEKTHGLAWHYRKAESELGFIRSRELMGILLEIANNKELKVVDGNKVIEVKNSGVDKGTASKILLSKNDYDMIVALGDDKTDEDMFQTLSGNQHFTIKVGHPQSSAKYYLLTVPQVHTFLNTFLNVN